MGQVFPISVIVPTYNGRSKVLRLLDALAQQTHTDFEVVLVVDGSTDDTVRCVQTLAPNYPFSLRILEQVNRGRAVARNNGGFAASAALLLFYDDDMRPEADNVERHVAFHAKHPGVILVGSAQSDAKFIGRTDFGQYRLFIEQGWLKALPKSCERLQADKVFITAAHFSLPKLLFEQLEGFDNRLNDAEDLDMALRCRQLNIPVYSDVTILAWHDDPQNCARMIQRHREYYKTYHYYRQLKSDLAKLTNRLNLPKSSGLKRLIFNFFARAFWVKVIDRTTWLKWLPRSLRFKVYTLVVYGLALHFPNRKID